jgi:HPt (histidine-containing phosphotransfer) domain-containing protein
MEFVREMISVFLEESGPEIKSLEKAVYEGDFEQIRQLSHKLRSSIPYVGLDIKVGGEVAEIEDLAKSQTDLSIIEELFQKVQKVTTEAVKELEKLEV